MNKILRAGRYFEKMNHGKRNWIVQRHEKIEKLKIV